MWILISLLSCSTIEGLANGRAGQAELEFLGPCASADDAKALYQDVDYDGFGAIGTSAFGCMPVDGYSDVSGDCDDKDPDVHPGAIETCNGQDDDCDYGVDEAPDTLWCLDVDYDGYGDPNQPGIHACERPGGDDATYYVQECTDCDDADPTVGGGCGGDSGG
jgi:hypothetical protein